MRKVFTILFLSVCLSSFVAAQQYTIEGRINDKQTGAPLAFVNMIVTGNPQIGSTADIDGNFKISASFPITSLSFSYVGYKDQAIPIHDTSHTIKHLVVKLEEASFSLKEVTILPGINPALRIIQRAIDNSDKNNPEKVRSFTYTSYNKMYGTSDLKATVDTLNSLDSLKASKALSDTSKKKKEGLSGILKKQYLFLTESIGKRKFLYPDHNHDEIIAQRTSGLKDSPFALLATQLQSFSFYKEYILILDGKYLNPISSAGIKRYIYIIEDTLYKGKDTVFVISYHPKKGKNFDGMKGVVYINTYGYALQNVLAQPIKEDNTISIHIQQKYDYINGKQWFPVQLNTDWVYNNIQLSDTTLESSNEATNPDDEHNKLKIVTRSYIKDIVLDTILKKRDFGRVEVEIADNASKQNDSVWNKYRIDTLSAKEKKTYAVIDSVGKATHLDQKIRWFEALATGKLRMGWANLDLDRVITYNGYEKLRLGAGLHTNDEISKFVSVGGYGAYGFGDEAFKYGGDVGFLFNPYSHLKLDFAYKNDVVESGGVSFYNDDHLLSSESYHSYFVNNMDKIEQKQISLSFDALRYFQFNLFGDEQLRTATNSYEFGVNGENSTVLFNQFNFTEVGLSLRFAYGENFLKSPMGMISLGTNYPIVWANITHGFNGLFNGQYDYMKYDLKVSKVFHIPQLGSFSISALAGYVNGNVPYTILYNGNACYEQYTLAVDNSFETMRLNEFLSDKYVNLFVSHDFESFLFRSGSFRPHLKLITHMGWGMLDNAANHFYFPTPIESMNKGYYESGIELNNLIKENFVSLGVGAYYRYGPYSLPSMSNNFAFKFTVGFAF
ncbi:MAG TPA: DUF5686 family protein [Bacteroidia bacterium]|nr:DUF5686 family protein [Bacteroidia bacterium]